MNSIKEDLIGRKKKEDPITVPEFLQEVNTMALIKEGLLGITMKVEVFTVQEFLREVKTTDSVK
jgi:hypothetical protein